MIGFNELIKIFFTKYTVFVSPNISYYFKHFIEFLIKMIILYGGVLSFAGILTLLERKISALIQDRVGPERANIWKFTLWGLFHPLADGIKMIMKEDFIPEKANKILFTISPIIVIFSVLIVFVFLPFGNYLEIFGYKIKLIVIETDLAIFMVIALSSLAIYGVFGGGFFSGNTWGIIGSMRAVSQMISYEVITLFSLLPMLMIYNASTLHQVIEKQTNMIFGFIPSWGIILQPFAFIFFLTAALCENKRTPFDVVEGESEIIGYFIEYSSMRFGAFMFAEYIEIIFFSMIITIFFLGGWHIPFLHDYGFVFGSYIIKMPSQIIYLMEIVSFGFKVASVSIFIIFLRWTLPRFRFDQIVSLAWKGILPLSIINIIITAILLRFMK